ncbi:MAG: DNA polymerase I [Rhabdochlamydiaceae bacterium]
MAKIYIIDAVNLIFRSYFAISKMTNEEGLSTNALYGFIRMMNKFMDQFQPSHVVAVFDGANNRSKRTAIYPAYKSHRQKMPEDLYYQIENSIKFCELRKIPYICEPDYEADDVIGGVCKWAEEADFEVFICSGDKDLCQLVSDKTSVLHLHNDNLMINKDGVKEIYGVYPHQIVDYLALVGDASDNIPGVEGFGNKTVIKLLEKAGSLSYILEHPEVIEGDKKQKTFIAQKELALISQRLASLDLSVNIPKIETFYRLSSDISNELMLFYQKMNFKSLMKNIKPEEDETMSNLDFSLVDSLHLWETFCLDSQKSSFISLQVKSFSLDGKENSILACALSKDKIYIFDLEQHPLYFEKLIIFLSVFSHPIVAHDFKGVWHTLKLKEIRKKDQNFDTMIASYLLRADIPKHTLSHLAHNKLQIHLPTQQDKLDLVSIYRNCAEESYVLFSLKEKLEDELTSNHLLDLFYQVEMPLISVLWRMEHSGIKLDVDKLKDLEKEFLKELDHLTEQIHSIAQTKFNLNSPKQLSQILFDKMGIKPIKKTQTGLSTSAQVLEELSTQSPIIPLILQYRSLEKLRSTYTAGLIQQIHPASLKVHCTFNQSVTATGRLSCQNPNLQNIPVRTEEGLKIRQTFIPSLTEYSFFSADYSQIELRLLAHLSEDTELMKAFHDRIDVHNYTASLMFNKTIEEVTPSMRHQAKAINYGILYGQQAYGLAQTAKINYSEAQEFIKKYFLRYPKVHEYLESCKEQARKDGFVRTITGRLRPLPDILSKNSMLRQASERLAINSPLQGSNADIIKQSMIEIDDYLIKHPQKGKMLLQIHDELLFETPDEELICFSSFVKDKMETVVSLKVPLVVDISFGKNWGEC